MSLSYMFRFDVSDENDAISTYVVRALFFTLTAGFIVLISYGITALSVPFAISLLLSFLLNPFVDYLESRIHNRGLSVLLVLSLIAFFIYLFFSFGLPSIMKEVDLILAQSETLTARAISLFETGKAFFTKTTGYVIRLDEVRFEELSDVFFRDFQTYSQSTFKKIPAILLGSLMTLLITFFFLLESHQIYKGLMSLVPNRFFEMTLQIVYRIRERIASYLKGLVIQQFILAAIMVTGFIIIGLPYAPAVGLFASFVTIIPYLGPVLGLIPIVAAALLDPTMSLAISSISIFLIAHLVDNVYTQPVVLAKSAELHPLIGIIALISFEHLFGLTGMVIAIPAASIIMVTIQVMYRSLKAFRII